MTISTTRRKFIQIASAAGTLASLGGTAGALEEEKDNPRSATDSEPIGAERSLLSLVNPMQGTNSNFEFSRGNTLPIVAMPFGMGHWTLQSHDKPGWFFEPAACRLQGVRLTHQLSPWLGDYGYASFLPFQGNPGLDPTSRSSSYRPDEMKISPAGLKMRLMRYRCWLEMTPTIRSGAMRVTYEEPGEGGMLIDLPGKDAEASCNAMAGVITALTRKNSGGVQANFATYLYIRFDRPIKSFAVKETGDGQVAEVRFRTESAKPVEVRIGTSFISMDQARLNLKQENGQKPFDALLQDAEDKWESELGRVRIQGRTEYEHRTFYSCLYRTLLFPRVWHEIDSSGQTVHRSPYTGSIEPGVLYADHGFWDDYHAWYPMMALLYPERLSEILQGWVNAYREGGWIPQFPCPGYRGAMTGSPSDMVFGDAAAKGIKGFDLAVAYEGLRKGATIPVNGFGFGRDQLRPYLKLGYVPSGNGSAGVAQTLDYAYGDFCVSQVARALGLRQDAAFFLKRSSSWKNIFDPKTKFFRGRSADGSWLEPFNALAWGGAYVEGGPWQYRFNVPHDPYGLFEVFGGEAKFVKQLEKMFVQPPRFDVGTYGGEIHEMAEMAAVDFGQYAQCNQPVHNVLYLFTIAGRRDRTQHYAYRVLSELYSPDDFPGDEDTGSMSAWYVLSALGLFSACPGSSKWTLGAPYFDAANVKFPNGEALEIIARNRRSLKFLNRVSLNGQLTEGKYVEHANLRNAQIVFEATG